MTSGYSIRPAEVRDAALVGRMIERLMVELYPDDSEYVGPGASAHFAAAAERLLGDEPRYFVFLARDATGTPAGVMTLNECAAIYAWGRFGEISELYVEPARRSTGLGAMLIDHAKVFAAERGWPMLEVGAADAPRWQKSIDFYRRCGFEEIGPRLYLMVD